MDLNELNFLPEWDEKFLHAADEGDEWKTRPDLETDKALYNQWLEVFGLVAAFAETLSDDVEGEAAFTQKLIYENAMIVAPKIMTAAGDTLYVIKMENAAIIRVNCRQLMEQVGFAALTGMADAEHKDVIAEAMADFRFLFKNWVATFQKDDCTDDWGLFV